MPNIDPTDLNPHRITEEQRAALRAADPDAFDDEHIEEPTEVDAHESPSQTSDLASVPETENVAPARGSVPMIPKPRLNEVLNRVSELERQLRDRDARDAAVGGAVQDRDFAAERGQVKAQWDAEIATLKKQWDDGDLDADKYHDQRRLDQ